MVLDLKDKMGERYELVCKLYINKQTEKSSLYFPKSPWLTENILNNLFSEELLGIEVRIVPATNKGTILTNEGDASGFYKTEARSLLKTTERLDKIFYEDERVLELDVKLYDTKDIEKNIKFNLVHESYFINVIDVDRMFREMEEYF